ncbi:hypothetical protein PRZ48_004243 [Zasmidium cellare]|uniref:Uncharacterized protein n=1 Tax=Zasmidium cellare TaxID=395010 RepID=A0ABR0E0Q3_ZASCE|nr:hypothetical protein PRZ48_015299 [Zasmidium cellare]KAK4494994.1 hypothetical protein PRZ48_014350 [Zasmidium cellare]KAK4503328.1 hypothetical protein PRZ48_004243 [Zasmidium cellare]
MRERGQLLEGAFQKTGMLKRPKISSSLSSNLTLHAPANKADSFLSRSIRIRNIRSQPPCPLPLHLYASSPQPPHQGQRRLQLLSTDLEDKECRELVELASGGSESAMASSLAEPAFAVNTNAPTRQLSDSPKPEDIDERPLRLKPRARQRQLRTLPLLKHSQLP